MELHTRGHLDEVPYSSVRHAYICVADAPVSILFENEWLYDAHVFL